MESFDTSEGFAAYGSAGANVATSWTESGGRDGGGGVSVTRTSGTGTFNGWLPVPCDLVGKTKLGTSILLRTDNWSDGTTLHLGFVNNAGNPPSGSSSFWASGSAYRAISARLIYDASNGGRFRLRLYNKVGTGGASSFGSEVQFAGLDGGANAGVRGQWLRLSVALVPYLSANDAYRVVAILEKLGGGSEPPETIMATGTFAITNASLFGATAAYPACGLSIGSGGVGIAHFDDHQVDVSLSEPDAPVAIGAEMHTTTRLTAKWTAPTLGAVVSGYVLELVEADAPFETGRFIAADGTGGQAAGISLNDSTFSQAFIGLERNQGYAYRVRAVNSVGAGPNSNTVETSTSDTNVPPTLDAIASPLPLYPEETATRHVNLTGIGTGGDDGQALALTAVSSDPGIVPHPAIGYDSPSETGTLSYAPTGTEGVTTITVTADDGEDSVSRSFVVRVQRPPLTYGFADETELEQYGGGRSANVATAWDVGGGVGDPAGGGLSVQRIDGSTGYHTGWRLQPFDFAGKNFLRTSILINMKEWNSDGNLHLGFVTDTSRPDGDPAPGTSSNILGTGNSYRAVALHMNYSRFGNRFRVRFHNKAGTGSSSQNGGDILVPYVAGGALDHWIRLTLSLVPTATANRYSATADIEDLGPDGLSAPVLLNTGSTDIINAPLATAGRKAYAAYHVELVAGNTGRTRLDNHETEILSGAPHVPEALPAIGTTTTKLTANWRRSATGGYPVQGYVVELTTAEDHFAPGTFIDAGGQTGRSEGVPVPHAGTSLGFSGLVRGAAYVYRVRGRNIEGESDPSNAIAASTSVANIPPTLDPVPPQPSIHPGDTAPRTVNLTGVSNGGDDGQTVTVAVESSNPSVIGTGSVSYASPNATGSFVYTPTGQAGSATLTVTADDGEGVVVRSTTIHVRTPPGVLRFDSSDEAIGEFGYASNSPVYGAFWSDSEGAGDPPGGGFVLPKISTGYHSWAAWRKQTFDLRSKTFVGTSLAISPREWTGTTNYNGTICLGFASGAVPSGTDFLMTGSSYRSFYVQMEHDAGSNNRFALQLYNKSGTGDTVALGTVQYINNASSVKSNWLRLSADFVPVSVGSNTYNATLRLENIGPKGTSAAQILAEHHVPLVNASLAGAAAAHAAYSVSRDSSGFGNTYLDNHEAAVSAGVPLPPLGLAADLVVKHAFIAQWSRSASVVDGYVLEVSRATAPFGPGTLLDGNGADGHSSGITLPASATSLRIRGLDPSTDYVYRVRAVNAHGAGGYSNTVPVTTSDAGDNRPPTLDDIVSPYARVLPDSGRYLVNLTGITAGGESDQPLAITASSSDEAVILAPEIVNYNPVAGTAQVRFEPGSAAGPATITITVDDGWPTDSTVSKAFAVEVHSLPETVSFDGSNGDWMAEYSSTNDDGSSNSVWGATYGKDGTGGIRVSYTKRDPDYASGWRNQTYNLNEKTYIETSILVKPSSWGNLGQDERFLLGFADRRNLRELLLSGPASALGAMLGYDKGTEPHLHLALFNKEASADATVVPAWIGIPNGSSRRNHWLLLAVKLTPAASPAYAYDAVATVHDLGPSGTDVPDTDNLVATTTGQLTNPAIFTSTGAYAAYTHAVAGEDASDHISLDDHRVTVVGGPPKAPAALPATVVTGRSFTANWSPPDTSLTDGYVLEVSTNENFAGNTLLAADGTTGRPVGIDLPRGTTHLRLEGLANRTAYWYRVKAYNALGEGGYSNTVAVSTLAAGINAPPTLDAPALPLARVTPGTMRVVQLTGITDGGEGNQSVTVSASSSNPEIADASVVYVPNATTAQLRIHGRSQTGVATVTVIVGDGQDQVSADIPVTVALPPATIGFGTPGDLAAELTLHSNLIHASHSATGGVGGGGALSIDDDESEGDAVNGWRKEVYQARGAEVLRTSLMMHFALTKEGETQVGVGFVHHDGPPETSHQDWLKTNGAGQYISAHLRRDEDEFEILIGNKTGSGGNELGKIRITDGPHLSNWLRLGLELVPREPGGNEFNATLLFENMGPDGTSPPQVIRKVGPYAVANPALGQSDSTYAAFHLMGKRTGRPFYLDDHFVEVVHPPAGPALALEQPLNHELASGATTVYFGILPVGGSSRREFVIRNVGSETLTGIAATASGDAAAFVAVGTPSATTLLPGEAATLDVAFHNGKPGMLSAALRVTSAETADAPFEVALAAEGLAMVRPGTPLSANPRVSLGRKLGGAGSDFGRVGGALATSGRLVAVGSDPRNGGGDALPGTVAVHDLATGTLLRRIAPPAGAGSEFGRSVAVFGEFLAVGSPLEDGAGAVYVYSTRDWTLRRRIVAPSGESGSRFGHSVGLDAALLAVGDPSASGSGKAYLYDLPTGIVLKHISPSIPSAGQEFGAVLTVDGGQILVGAPGELGAGAAYLFADSGGPPLLRLSLPGGASGDRFGASLSMGIQRIVVGAPGRGSDRGAAFLYDRNDGALLFGLSASDTTAGDAFGSSVALTSSGVLVAAEGKGEGTVYLLDPVSGAEIYRITAADGAGGDGFGRAVAAAGDRVLVGAPSHGGGGIQRGAVYTLRFPPYQVDGTVGATSTGQMGRGIHNRTGAGQTLNLVSRKLRKVKAFATTSNDGLALDTIRVRGTAGNRLFKVAYFTANGERANVTAAMTKGGVVLANLASGELRSYSVEIAPQKKLLQRRKNGKTVVLKKKFNGRITSDSAKDPTKSDVVIYRVQTR